MNSDENVLLDEDRGSADIASQVLKDKGFIIMDRSIDRGMIQTQTLNMYNLDTRLLVT